MSVVAVALAAALLAAEPPPIAGPVTDRAAGLSDREEAELRARLTRLQAEHEVRMAVLVVESTAGRPVEDFTATAAERWRGGGAERGDGVLLVLAVKEQRIGLDQGRGLPVRLPDSAVAGIVARAAPALHAERYAAAISGVIDDLGKLVALFGAFANYGRISSWWLAFALALAGLIGWIVQKLSPDRWLLWRALLPVVALAALVWWQMYWLPLTLVVLVGTVITPERDASGYTQVRAGLAFGVVAAALALLSGWWMDSATPATSRVAMANYAVLALQPVYLAAFVFIRSKVFEPR